MSPSTPPGPQRVPSARASGDFSVFRKFPLARSADSGSLRLSGTGGDPLRNQGPNKAWDATRQSGLVPTGWRSPVRTSPE